MSMQYTVCRKSYTNKRRYEQQGQSSSTVDDDGPPQALRSRVDLFDRKIHCFFCGTIASQDSRYRDSTSIFSVRTLELRDAVMQECRNRNDTTRSARTSANVS
jgi:hypothetical protein